MTEMLWPQVEVAQRRTDAAAEPYVRSYIFMRFAIGVLGLALPPLLVFLEPLLFDGQPWPRGSLSAYYYSGVRELFVGILCAIGVFLVIYKISERTREGRVSTYAGAAVIVVALFPTGKPGAAVRATPLQDLLGEKVVETIHFCAAGVFILLLALISRYFGKYHANGRRFHYACAAAILLAFALAAFAGFTGEPDKGILIAEWLAVWAFGASWLRTVEFDKIFGD
jgi:uncharacterized membrane protein